MAREGERPAKIREKEPATCLIFCRHGETDYPDDRFYPPEGFGCADGSIPGLTATGRDQARRLAQFFGALERVDALYVSPTQRTRQTADPIARAAGVEPVILDDLIERRMGNWEGRSAEEIRAADPGAWNEWKTKPVCFAPPGGETLETFRERVAKAVDLIRQRGGGVIGIVTHVGVIRVATATALQMPLQNCKRLLVSPGSVTRIHYTKSWPNLVLWGHQP